jgi:hypothetical protein
VLYSNGAFGMYTGVSGTGNTWMQSQRNDANTATYNILLNPLGGNVGIGVTNPSARLHVDGTVRFSSSGDRIFIADGSFGTFELGDIDGVSDEAKIVGNGSNIIISNTGTETLTCSSNNRVGIGITNPSAKLTVVAPYTSSGTVADFKVSGGSNYGMTVLKIENPSYGFGIAMNRLSNLISNDTAINFQYNGSQVGKITINTTSTSYNTTSDYRLKENREEILNAFERVKLLKPSKFSWVNEPTQEKVDGFYAHELAEVIPEAVTGKKDALDYQGKPEYQSVDQSKVVPLLAAALQQAINKIEELEIRILTLENK